MTFQREVDVIHASGILWELVAGDKVLVQPGTKRLSVGLHLLDTVFYHKSPAICSAWIRTMLSSPTFVPTHSMRKKIFWMNVSSCEDTKHQVFAYPKPLKPGAAWIPRLCRTWGLLSKLSNKWQSRSESFSFTSSSPRRPQHRLASPLPL